MEVRIKLLSFVCDELTLAKLKRFENLVCFPMASSSSLSPVLARPNPVMSKKLNQERLILKQNKRKEKEHQRLIKKQLRQEALEEKRRLKMAKKLEQETFKKIKHDKKQQQLQILNDQLTLVHKINQIHSMINLPCKSYIDPKITDILNNPQNQNLLNTLIVLNKLKPSNLSPKLKSEYLIFGYIKESLSSFIPSLIVHLTLKFHGDVYDHIHTQNNQMQRVRFIQKLTHEINTHFKLCIVNKITSTYPITKKLHRELKKILKQYQKTSRKQTFGAHNIEQYKLMEIGDAQIIYEHSDFPQGVPVLFVHDVSSQSNRARLCIGGGLFNGLSTDFTPNKLRWCLDRFPIEYNGIIQFYEYPIGVYVSDNDNDNNNHLPLIIYYKGVNIVNNGQIMDGKRVNAFIKYKINGCFLENGILRDKTSSVTIWAYLFTLKQYIAWYEVNVVNQQFNIDGYPVLFDEILQIIKDYTYQNVNVLYNNYDDKLLLIWFLSFSLLNDEWIEWIIKYVLFDDSVIREELSIAIAKYDMSGFIMQHIQNRKLLKYLLEILCCDESMEQYQDDLDNFIRNIEITDSPTVKYLLRELSKCNDTEIDYNYHKFIEKLLTNHCLYECCLYDFIVDIEQSYINAILALYTPSNKVIKQILNAVITRNKLKYMKYVLNIMSCLIKATKNVYRSEDNDDDDDDENEEDEIDWSLFLKVVLLYTEFEIDSNLMQLIINTTIKYKSKTSYRDKSIFQYVFLEHICKTELNELNEIQDWNLKLFFKYLTGTNLNEQDKILKKQEFDINVGVLYCCEFKTDCILRLLIEETPFIDFDVCVHRGYLSHLNRKKSQLTPVANEILAQWCQKHGESFSSCIVM